MQESIHACVYIIHARSRFREFEILAPAISLANFQLGIFPLAPPPSNSEIWTKVTNGFVAALIMGQSFRRPAFTEEQLYDYQDCTYFTRNEILRLYRRFCSLRPGTVDRRAADVSTRLSFLDVQAMPELRYNPFKVSLYLTSFYVCRSCRPTWRVYGSDQKIL